MLIKSYKIGIILGSTRSPRVCPQIGTFITNTLTPLLPSSVEFSLIDISINPLPMYDEPGIPSLIPESSGYTHTHTQTWSHLISSHDAFIFITPQYNWGYPASLKNAIDYLFFEWRAKPTMIVSYGGHGGGKAASQLRQVLEGGLKMKVVETMPALTFPDRDVMRQASRGEELALPEGAWEKEGEDVKRGFGEMLRLLGDS